MTSRRGRSAAAAVMLFCTAAAMVFCAAPASAAEPPVKVKIGKGARAAAFRPGTRDLYVVNWQTDMVSIASYPDPAGASKKASVKKKRDAYAEHFMIMPSGLAFNADGSKFATSHESGNWYRDRVDYPATLTPPYQSMDGYMGPTLWETEQFAILNQDKRYKAGRRKLLANPNEDDENDPWGEWFGSHIDMLHESPYASGIVWGSHNRFYVLDGCGQKTRPLERPAGKKTPAEYLDSVYCKKNGHLVLYDFNNDHGYGGHWHENGVVMRFLDAPFKRVVGVISGIVKVGDHVIYADTGSGVIRRVAVDGASSGARSILVRSWDPAVADGRQPVPEHQDGRGLRKWEEMPDAEFKAIVATIDSSLQPEGIEYTDFALARWLDKRRNDTAINAVVAAGTAGGFDGSFIKPNDWLHAYGVQLGAQQSVLASGLSRPSGIALDATRTPPRLYVATQPAGGYGTILVYHYDAAGAGTLTKVYEIETTATDLQGLAMSPLLPDQVFYVDAKKGTVSWEYAV